MILKYINLWLSPETGYDNDYRYEFMLHTRFINHYLSIKIRKHKFNTEDFTMISVDPVPNGNVSCKMDAIDCLSVSIPFDNKEYEENKKTNNFEYYLKLLEEGFKGASEYRQIPLNVLLEIIDEFRSNKYKNEWRHKKKQFKELDLEIILDCKFTTLDFELIVTVNKISNKKQLITGVIIRTLPYEIYFDKIFRDILIDTDDIIITDASDSPRVKINLTDALNEKFNFKLVGDDLEFNKLLSYKGNVFF